jgi:hypothetical protein
MTVPVTTKVSAASNDSFETPPPPLPASPLASQTAMHPLISLNHPLQPSFSLWPPIALIDSLCPTSVFPLIILCPFTPPLWPTLASLRVSGL